VGLPNIRSHDVGELTALVKLIDSNLEFIRDLHPDATSSRSLLVDENGTRRVLKVRQRTSNMWDDLYFHFEIHALRRVSERNLSGVSHMVREYETETHHAILKTYARGTPLDELDADKLLRDKSFIRRLDDLYLKLHLAGIAKINFQPRKIIVDENGDLTLVDLSTCIVNTEAGILQFAQELRTDSVFLTQLEKAAAG
jgi:hypothetical protein